MQKNAEKMMEDYRPKTNKEMVHEIKPHFVLLSGKKASIIKRQSEIESAKSCIDFITSWKRFPRTIDTFGDDGIQVLKRGVKMRVILEKPIDMNQIPEIVNEIKKFPNYELRYILDQPSAIIGIFDEERVIIKTSASVGLAEQPSLWSDNQCLVSVIQDHFEMMWITALEKIPEKIVDQ